MKVLTKKDIMKIMAEELNLKITTAINEIEMFSKDRKKILVSPDLKVRHSETGLLYTIDSVGPVDVVLRNPEGGLFNVDHQEFEKKYDLD